METNVNYTIVGAFVILLITAIVLSIIWLSSGFSFVQYSTYKIYMQESVTGLSIDSPVEYNGVNVGAIKSIQINHRNPRLVELLLNIKNDTPITQGTVATIDARGVTGITYIQLKDKGTNLAPLFAQNGEPYPVIATAPSIFTRLDTILTALSTNFGELTTAINALLSPENQRSIKNTLHHLDMITTTLAQNSNRIDTILSNTAHASYQFSPFMQSSATAIRALETQTLPATYQLIYNLDNMTRNLNNLSVELKQNPSIIIRGAAPAQLGPGESR